jgi:hypothetical protein
MDATDLTKIPDEIVAVSERAQKAEWDVQWAPDPSGDELPTLYIWIPNGRDKRRLGIGLTRAKRILAVPFEQYRLLGDYLAVNNSSASYIEVAIRSSARTFGAYNILDVPGIEIIERAATDSAADEDGEAADETVEPTTEREAIHAGARWRLRMEDNRHRCSIEFSEASGAFLALVSDPAIRLVRERRPPPTLKIYGINASSHDEALRRLEDIAGAIFFDLDLRYGIQLELGRYRARPSVRFHKAEPFTRVPSFPRLRYPPEALSLYWYGRSESGMPLLQFLAYYQVLEFFFPMHFRQHLLRRLRQELTDPRFDVTDDAHLARLLTTAISGGRVGYGSEREQLKATINGCVDESTLRDFLREDPELLHVLADKKTIKHVPAVVDDGHHGNLIDQVSERIYAIRNRVVHAKGDGSETAVDLLLPGSPEAAALAADVSVLKFLAQKAIVAGGTSFSY